MLDAEPRENAQTGRGLLAPRGAGPSRLAAGAPTFGSFTIFLPDDRTQSWTP